MKFEIIRKAHFVTEGCYNMPTFPEFNNLELVAASGGTALNATVRKPPGMADPAL
jgi:hypothetical protein